MARLFDGVDDDIDINTGFEPTNGKLTICWWQRADHNITGKRFLGPLDGSNNGYRISYGSGGGTGRPSMGVRIGGTFETVGGAGTTSPTIDEWNLLVFQFDDNGGGTGAIEYYVNDMDTPTATEATSGSYDAATQSFHLGSHGDGLNEYDGELGSFMIFDDFLNANQRKAVKMGKLPLQPMVYYRNDFASATEPDLSGNGNNGSVTGTTRTTNPPISMLTRVEKASIFGIAAPAANTKRSFVPAVIG